MNGGTLITPGVTLPARPVNAASIPTGSSSPAPPGWSSGLVVTVDGVFGSGGVDVGSAVCACDPVPVVGSRSVPVENSGDCDVRGSWATGSSSAPQPVSPTSRTSVAAAAAGRRVNGHSPSGGRTEAAIRAATNQKVVAIRSTLEG